MHDLQDLINQIENAANELKVVVFDDANPYFYIAHVDILCEASIDTGSSGIELLPDFIQGKVYRPSGHQYCLHCNSVAQFFEKLLTFHQDQKVMFSFKLLFVYQANPFFNSSV